jgi:FKBP-type peptidyl-prolyl cis-trans isomerase
VARPSRYLILITALAAAVLATTGCSPASTSGTSATPASAPTGVAPATPPAESTPTAGSAVPAATELKIEDKVVGTGAAAKTGDLLTVDYTGWLSDGTKFESSLDPGGQPVQFALGVGEVIPGWDQGVAGMKEGGVRRLTIPPGLAYGAAGAGRGAIPPNATLVFEISLISVN